jgi:hypothetical protein
MKQRRLLVLGAALFGVAWVGFNPEWLESVGIGQEYAFLAIFFFTGFVDWGMQAFRPTPHAGDGTDRDVTHEEKPTK